MQPVRASNGQHMEARWLPATQSGLHYLAHTGIIKEADQRADYLNTAELLNSFLFVLSLCRLLLPFVVLGSFLLSFFDQVQISSLKTPPWEEALQLSIIVIIDMYVCVFVQ